MKTFEKIVISVSALLLLMTMACSKEETSLPDNSEPIITEKGVPTGAIEETTIGPDGGVVYSSDGLLTITIPAGALNSAIPVSIQPISNTAPLSVGMAYRLGPEGTSFDIPITLSFAYNDEVLGLQPSDFLWIVYQENDGSWNAMLQSTVNTIDKTVSVKTSHFSDWSLGRFIDLTLEPAAMTVKKGGQLVLTVSGFASQTNSDDDLAPLIPISNNDDDLTPLPIIKPLEDRELDFKIAEWTLNGGKAPVNNSYGSLNARNRTATYTAPNTVPNPNPVSVSVKLETSDKEGKKSSFYLASNITVLENELYLTISFKGKTYNYYQYGFDGNTDYDPNDFSMANCAMSNNKLGITGSTWTSSTLSDGFAMELNGPSVGNHGLVGINGQGEDGMSFSTIDGDYELLQKIRTVSGDYCDIEYDDAYNCYVSLTEYSGTYLSIVEGSITGTLYQDPPNASESCTSSIGEQISGTFRLVLLTQP